MRNWQIQNSDGRLPNLIRYPESCRKKLVPQGERWAPRCFLSPQHPCWEPCLLTAEGSSCQSQGLILCSTSVLLFCGPVATASACPNNLSFYWKYLQKSRTHLASGCKEIPLDHILSVEHLCLPFPGPPKLSKPTFQPYSLRQINIYSWIIGQTVSFPSSNGVKVPCHL